jgi:hypothetical protein
MLRLRAQLLNLTVDRQSKYMPVTAKPSPVACRTALCHVEVVSSNKLLETYIFFNFPFWYLTKTLEQTVNFKFLVKLRKIAAEVCHVRGVKNTADLLKELAQNEFRGCFWV